VHYHDSLASTKLNAAIDHPTTQIPQDADAAFITTLPHKSAHSRTIYTGRYANGFKNDNQNIRMETTMDQIIVKMVYGNVTILNPTHTNNLNTSFKDEI
jgi:hypothetical protein